MKHSTHTQHTLNRVRNIERKFCNKQKIAKWIQNKWNEQKKSVNWKVGMFHKGPGIEWKQSSNNRKLRNNNNK